MARNREFEENNSGWLITFADLVTLLLALFVLIFSMSSLDSSYVQNISSSINREMPKRDLNRGEITDNIRRVAQLVMEVQDVHRHEGRIKELLFPRDLLPPGIDKGTLDTNLQVEERGEGVAFVISDQLLFEGAGSRISEAGRAIINSMGPLMEVVPGDVQIIAFYDGPAMPDLPDDYAVAGRHALAALGVFINRDVNLRRLSVSAYGADRAFDDLKDGAVVSRVEILFKTARAAMTGVSE